MGGFTPLKSEAVEAQIYPIRKAATRTDVRLAVLNVKRWRANVYSLEEDMVLSFP